MTNNAKFPIGITIPIRKTASSYFDQSYDTLTQIRSNIINLLNTKPGERRMQPTFGSRLWTLVFEQNTEMLAEKARRIVEEDISIWVPGVTISNTDVSLLKNQQSIEDIDIYRLHISVQYVVNTTKQSDILELNVDSIK